MQADNCAAEGNPWREQRKLDRAGKDGDAEDRGECNASAFAEPATEDQQRLQTGRKLHRQHHCKKAEIDRKLRQARLTRSDERGSSDALLR
jgi:hypothetical protein